MQEQIVIRVAARDAYGERNVVVGLYAARGVGRVVHISETHHETDGVALAQVAAKIDLSGERAHEQCGHARIEAEALHRFRETRIDGHGAGDGTRCGGRGGWCAGPGRVTGGCVVVERVRGRCTEGLCCARYIGVACGSRHVVVRVRAPFRWRDHEGDAGGTERANEYGFADARHGHNGCREGHG